MKIKILVIFSVLIFVCQIAYSIFFSIKIVDENTTINLLMDKIDQSNIDNQVLKNQLATLNSLETINQHALSKSFIPIQSTIDLNK